MITYKTPEGTKIKVLGRSRKGKERIKRKGDIWTIHTNKERIPSKPGWGPWIFITPDVAHTPGSRIWIHHRNDPDFEIIKVLIREEHERAKY